MISMSDWEKRFDMRRAYLKEHPELLLRCTDRQAEILKDHYLGYKSISSIAKRYGVYISTISRTIENGWRRLEGTK